MVVMRVVRGDITGLEVDAIVNAANSSLLGGGGVDGAIHRAAGPALLEQCRAVVARQGGCPPGQAVITGGGDLPATHVIHTVGPVWREGAGDVLDPVLGNCYLNSLQLAEANGVTSIAFPSISAGAYGYPKARAAAVAVEAVGRAVETAPSVAEILFVCFDDESARLYHELLAAPGTD